MLVNLASIMERADEALLPAVYREVGAAIHATPTGLGSLTLFRSIVQAACYPLAAYMATRHNRAHVIALGAFLWAAATFLVGISSTFLQVVNLDKLFVSFRFWFMIGKQYCSRFFGLLVGNWGLGCKSGSYEVIYH